MTSSTLRAARMHSPRAPLRPFRALSSGCAERGAALVSRIPRRLERTR